MVKLMRTILAGAALSLALAVNAHAATKDGAMSGPIAQMALPDKSVTAMLFVSRDVSDLDRSIKFYTEVFGLKEVGRFDYADGSTHEVFLGYDQSPSSVKIVLQNKKLPDGATLPPTDGINRVAFQVTDIKAVRERAVRYGGKTNGAINTVTNVLMAGISDPDGHRFTLIQQQ